MSTKKVPESYYAYLVKEENRQFNLNLWAHQAFVIAAIVVGGGIGLTITTSGSIGEAPVCTSIICALQLAGLIYACNLFRHYKKQ